MRQRKYSIYLLMLCLCSASVMAQLKIEGVVYDAETKRPIPYVGITIGNSFFGASSDFDGKFSFYTAEQYLDSVLTFRGVGYESLYIPIAEFQDSALTLSLAPKVYYISEFTTTADHLLENPNEIVGLAIRNLYRKQPTKRYTLYGTYQNIFQTFKGFKVEDQSNSNVKIKIGVRERGFQAGRYKEEPVRPLNDKWKNFRYNKSTVLPQYSIPDFGQDHLSFLLNINPIKNEDFTFDFVGTMSSQFIGKHWFWKDSVGEYNGRLTYFVNVFLKPSERFTYINYIPSKMLNGPLSGFTFSNNGNSGQLSIGKIWVDVEDLAIVYFEYNNGFLNDRYKFCVEYCKASDECYYPSKMYFANKFWLKNDPDFFWRGKSKNSGFRCEETKPLLHDIKKKYSRKDKTYWALDSIIQANTIYQFGENGKLMDEPYSVAYSKIIEDALLHFELRDYTKYFHHRILRIDSIELAGSKKMELLNPYTDYDRRMYYLGDYNAHLNLYNQSLSDKNQAKDTLSFHQSATKIFYKLESDTLEKSPILIPVTSSDEYRFIYSGDKDTTIFDKENLIKGYIFLAPVRLKEDAKDSIP